MARIYPSLGSVQNQTNSPNYGILNAPILHIPLQNNLNPTAGVGTVEFSRNSEGTYIDRYGLVATANIDEPRFEKNGLLIEGASTNKVLYSQDFSKTAKWKLVNGTAKSSLTGIKAPDGTDLSWGVFDDISASGTHAIYQDVTVTAQKTHTASIFLRKSTARFARVLLGNPGWTQYCSLYIDLQDGVVFNTGSLGAVEDFSFAFTKIFGWYRVSITAKINDAAVTTLRFETRIVNETTTHDLLDTYSSDPTNVQSVGIWGAQIEEQMFATSYVATDSLPVTRTSDYMMIDVLNLTLNYPSSENTYILDFDILGTKHETYRDIFRLEKFAYNIMRVNANGTHVAYYDAGGISDNTPLEALYQHRSAVRYANGTYCLFRNGFKVAEKRNASPYTNDFPTGKIFVGSSNELSENVLNGHITNFRIYDTALTDDEIRIL